MTISRRTFMGAAASMVCGVPRDERVTSLSEIAPELADMQVNAMRSEHPRDWRDLGQVDSIAWAPGVKLVAQFDGRGDLTSAEWTEARAMLEREGSLIAQGWSADRRCWVGFLRLV